MTEHSPLFENPLSLPLQIHHVDWPAGFFSKMSCSPTGESTQIYKHGDYEPCCLFHGAQYLSRSATRALDGFH